jgi:hypothetical protein
VLFAPEIKGIVEGSKAHTSWHLELESCVFAYDQISKISN